MNGHVWVASLHVSLVQVRPSLHVRFVTHDAVASHWPQVFVPPSVQFAITRAVHELVLVVGVQPSHEFAGFVEVGR